MHVNIRYLSHPPFSCFIFVMMLSVSSYILILSHDALMHAGVENEKRASSYGKRQYWQQEVSKER